MLRFLARMLKTSLIDLTTGLPVPNPSGVRDTNAFRTPRVDRSLLSVRYIAELKRPRFKAAVGLRAAGRGGGRGRYGEGLPRLTETFKKTA